MSSHFERLVQSTSSVWYKRENYERLKDIMNQLANQKRMIDNAVDAQDDKQLEAENEVYYGLIDLLLGELDDVLREEAEFVG